MTRTFKESSTTVYDTNGHPGRHYFRQKTLNHLIVGDCLGLLNQLPSNYCSLVIGSPPYPGKFKRYGQSHQPWSEFMFRIVEECCRVSGGYVLFVVNGQVKSGIYRTDVERLLLLASDESCIKVERPLIWLKNSPPNRKDWFSNTWEYILAFRNPHTTNFHFDWESIATPPKYTAGGRFRQRTSTGDRRLGSEYPQGKLARPRDVLHASVGGGHMGHPFASDNEAPFPERLIIPLIKCLSPEKSRVLDPFLGSGTTFACAFRENRLFTGIDTRSSQIDLTLRRMKDEFQ